MGLEFHRLCSWQAAMFAEAFVLYKNSFPNHEQRSLAKQRALMANPLYHFDVIVKGDMFIGIILYWEGSGYAYIEHFAVHTSMRGTGFGGVVLGDFCKQHPFVILEIDPPIDGISHCREVFYHRHGFVSNDFPHVHPAYRKELQPHELTVMSYPKKMSKKRYHVFLNELNNVVMKDSLEDRK